MCTASEPGGVRSALRKLSCAEDAAAAVEFSLVFPLCMSILLATVEFSRSIMVARKMQFVANTIGQIISSSDVGALTATTLADIRAVTPLVFPEVQKEASRRGVAWTNILQTTIASVKSTNPSPSTCKSSCLYNSGTMLWAYGAKAAGWSCNYNGVVAVAITAALANSQVPKDALSDGSLIAVQMSYSYQPLFFSLGWAGIFSAKTLTAAAYFKPRNFRQIVIDTTDATGVKLCLTQW